MKKTLKILFIALVPVLICISDLSAQIIMLDYRHVPPENMSQYIYRETTYWSEVAKKAIDEGKMVSWALLVKVGGWNMAGGSNVLHVNVFEKAEHINNLGDIWNPSKVFPDVPVANIQTGSLFTTNHGIYLRGVAGVGESSETSPQFVRINYAKASDLTKYLELEQSVWQPFIKGQMESKNSSQVMWRLSSLMMPAGADLPFNAVTVDGYNTLGEAVVPSTAWKETPEFPDFTALEEVHVKNRIQVYRLVKGVK